MAETKKASPHLLVVSRDSAVLRPLRSVAEPNGWHVETAVSAWDAIERIQSGSAPHLLVLDLPCGDGDFLYVLRWVRRLRSDLPVIVVCSPEDSGRKRDATLLGAQDCLLKPTDASDIESILQRHLVVSDGEGEIVSEDIEQLDSETFFVCASPATQKLRAQAELLAEADVPVLILGEVGSGKHTVAKLIHKLSVRSGFPFLKVNCADKPEDLLEAELFGRKRASARSPRQALGKIGRADKGTILLDEITEMPIELQGRLMQVLQDKSMLNPDGETAVSVDLRILATTSHSIDRAMAERKLREDLYYRLSAFIVQVPPLRQRKSEIPVLLQHSMHRLAKHYGFPRREFSAEILAACQKYSWPGNLNQLERFVKRYLVGGSVEFTFKELQPDFTDGGNGAASSQVDPHPNASDADQKHSGTKSLKCSLQNVKWEAERNAIGTALQKTGWNRMAASRLLDVSYRTLLYKIDRYQMRSYEPFGPLSTRKMPFGTPRGERKE